MLNEVIKNALTEADNRTWDIGRILATGAFLVGIGLSIYSVVWNKQIFNLAEFGTGIGVMIVSVGGYIGLKKEKTVTTTTIKETE